jgi:hypothetical protein
MMLPERAPWRDHVWTRSKGGTLNAGNRLIAGLPCNEEEGARSLVEFPG